MPTKKTYSEKLKDPRWQKMSGIYIISINGNKYIGSAVNLASRLRAHLNTLKSKSHYNKHLQRAFNKYGDITCDVLEYVADKNMLIEREQHYIDAVRPRYNIAPTAGSQLGFRHSKKTKQKISKMQIGKTIPEEARRNMSIAKLGRKYTAEHRRNISISKAGDKNPFYRCGSNHPQYGTHLTGITKRKISEALKKNGNLAGAKNAASRSGKIIDIENGIVYLFDSLKPMTRQLNLNYKGVTNALYKGTLYLDRWYTCYTAGDKT